MKLAEKAQEQGVKDGNLIKSLEDALVHAYACMRTASGLPKVNAQYDFTDALDSARAALIKSGRFAKPEKMWKR